MSIVDYVAIAVVALIVGAALFYIIRAKKRGEKCIGCPHSKTCNGGCNAGCNGGCNGDCGNAKTK